MYRKIYFGAFILVCCYCLVSCNNGIKDGDSLRLESGIEVIFHKNVESECGKIGDIIEFDAAQYIGKRELVNTFSQNTYFEREMLAKPKFEGDFMEVFSMLSPGDSAEMKIPISMLPDQVKSSFGTAIPDSELFVMKVRVHAIWNEDELIHDFVARYGGESEWKEINGGVWVKWDSISGGEPIDFGDTAGLRIRGLFLNGQPFYDTNADTLFFEVGSGTLPIKAWETAALNMAYGDRVTLISPHSMALGNKPQKPVLKYSTLVYELDLVPIENKSNKR